MAKKKSQKKFSTYTENPFNVKTNRNKHSVLGHKVRGSRGLPGVSHSVDNTKRKELFHQKRVLQRKANKFLDKRLLDSSQIYEDAATARLVQERKKKLRKSIFNLNDEESLTHKGMPLLSDKDLNDEVANSEDEEQLDSHFVKQAHFGGFAGDSAPKSRKEIIDELIVDSKRRKQERKVAKERNEDLIEQLDKEWKERHSSLPLLKGGKNQDLPEKNDPFDILLHELKFEKRTTPSSRLKTPEEIAKEEYEKKKKLEDERNQRMNPMGNSDDINNQFSADSIYDGLDIHFEPIDDPEDNIQNGTANEKSDDESDGNSTDASENESDNIDDKVNEPVLAAEDTCELPNCLETFCSVVNTHEEELYSIVENLLKVVIKNKTKINMEKLETFFGILIEYAMKACNNPNKALIIVDTVLPHLYTLAEISPLVTSEKLLFFLDEEQEIFQSSKGRKMKKHFPRFQCLILFKICSALYSVSDFKHPVVTPAIVFMCDILSSAYAASFQNIFSRLFICKIIYDCVSYSKRYVPEVIFFLNKALELAVDNSKKLNFHVSENVSVQEKIELDFEISEQLSDEIKASIINEIIEFFLKFTLLYTHLVSYKEIFAFSLHTCRKLPKNYPAFLKESISKFTDTVQSVKKSYKPLTYENKKPVPLKLFEPAFDSKFTRKKDNIPKKRKLVKSVGQKIKKEEKGMLREMRRDNQVIASEKLKERLEADSERKRKVKQLYQELAMQEGEFKKFVKKK